jgi:hypothetical protein
MILHTMTRLRLFDPGHGTLRKWTLPETLDSGRPRSAERRRGFTFVHRIRLDDELSRRVGDGLAELS